MRCGLTLARDRGHDVVVELIEAHLRRSLGADPDAANTTDWTYECEESGVPMVFAIWKKHFAIAHLLLDRGARVDYSFIDAAPGIVDYAYESGNQELLDRILANTIISHNREGDWDDYKSVVLQLLEYGIDPNTRQSDRKGTPLHWLSEADWIERENEDEIIDLAPCAWAQP